MKILDFLAEMNIGKLNSLQSKYRDVDHMMVMQEVDLLASCVNKIHV